MRELFELMANPARGACVCPFPKLSRFQKVREEIEFESWLKIQRGNFRVESQFKELLAANGQKWERKDGEITNSEQMVCSAQSFQRIGDWMRKDILWMATLKTQLENQVAKEMEIECVPTSLSYSSGSLMAAICFFPTQNRGLSRIYPSVLIVFSPSPIPLARRFWHRF